MQINAVAIARASGWSIERTLFKASCRAMEGLFGFGFPGVAFEAALLQFGVPIAQRYAAVSLVNGILHQLVLPITLRMQTLKTKQAIPVYQGNWWLNFIVIDHIAYEFTASLAIGGALALLELANIKNFALSVATGILLRPVAFFIWVLFEDFTNRFLLRRQSQLEEHQLVKMAGPQLLSASFKWAVARLLTPALAFYNLTEITIKVLSLYFNYWVGDLMASKWAGVEALSKAPPKMRALITLVKVVIIVEMFLFLGSRCPDAALQHCKSVNRNETAGHEISETHTAYGDIELDNGETFC